MSDHMRTARDYTEAVIRQLIAYKQESGAKGTDQFFDEVQVFLLAAHRFLDKTDLRP